VNQKDLNILGFGVLGSEMDDVITQYKAKIDEIAPVTYAVAIPLVNVGMKVTSRTLEIIKSGNTLVAKEAVERIQAQIAGHGQRIMKMLSDFGGKDPYKTIYPDAADLKKYVGQAFTEMFVAGYETEIKSSIWPTFWSEVGRSLASQAEGAAKTVQTLVKDVGAGIEGAGKVVSNLEWIVYGLVGALAIGLGVYAYKQGSFFSKARS
jgi:hypothetical protein